MRIQGWGFIDLNLDKILLKKTQGNCFSNKQLKCFKISWETLRNSQFFPPLATTNLNSSFFINSNLPPTPCTRATFRKNI